MTQVGEGHGAVHGAGAGAPVGGEVLAGRYQLEQHVNTDRAGRQIWRGVDVILRRPVGIVVRYPGGQAAAQMLRAAVEASRVVHPNLVGVYDAIDEETRAYVVREWVDGASLRDHIATGLFDTERAVAVAHAVSAAVTAVHATGMTHGNVHPGTVLIGLDGRVVLADARADGTVPEEEDVRAIGGLLYFSLTGYWPHGEVAGPAPLPDAMREPDGGLVAPRQIRAGVPDFLDNLTMDLLDRRLAVPPAEVLAGEFGRLDTASSEEYYDEPEPEGQAGPLRLSAASEGTPQRPSGRKIVAGVAGLLVVGVIGLLVGLNWLTGSSEEGSEGQAGAPVTASPSDEPSPAAEIVDLPLTAGQVRVVDPPGGNRAELDGIELVVDDDLSTAWRTDTYTTADFGKLKPGMGILIDLGEPRHVASVRVELGTPGATAEIRAGETDPGNSSAGDAEIVETYTPVGEPQQGSTTMVFTAFDPEQTYRYLMVFFTELPPAGDGFRVEVQQIAVQGY